TIGKPKIVLSQSGFRTPLTPLMRWDQVEGIHLQENSYRGRILSHTLNFRIPTLPAEIAGFAHFYRLAFLMRTRAGKERLQVALKETSEHPEVVYKLSRFLWTAATGRNYDWNPNFSEAFNAASRHPEVAGNQEIIG